MINIRMRATDAAAALSEVFGEMLVDPIGECVGVDTLWPLMSHDLRIAIDRLQHLREGREAPAGFTQAISRGMFLITVWDQP